MRRAVLLLSIALLFCGCERVMDSYRKDNSAPAPSVQSSGEQKDYYESKKAVASDESRGVGSSSDAIGERIPTAPIEPEQKQKLIKNAQIKYRVEKYSNTLTKIEKIVKSNSGYIAGENETNTSYGASNTITIRVFAENFDKLVTALMVEAKYIDYKRITTEDVTEQFVDLEARLKSKKAVEARYLELLKTAKKIDEILSVEKDLRVIQEEIEAAEGRLRYLNDRIGYSTITLEIYQTSGYTYKEPGFFEKAYQALGKGWSLLLGLIIGILYVWPVWVFIGIFVYLIYKLFKKVLKRKRIEQ
jgi:hypothetical protein